MEPLLKLQAAFPALKAPQRRTINQRRQRRQLGGGATGVAKNGNAVCVFASTGHARNLEGAQHIFYCSLHIAPLTVAYCSVYDAIAAWIMQCAWLRKN